MLRWLLLCLLAWPGPRPVAHAHEQLGSRVDSAACLAMHVDRWHGSDDLMSQGLDGWHVHWFWLAPFSDDPTSGSPSIQQVPVVEQQQEQTFELKFVAIQGLACLEASPFDFEDGSRLRDLDVALRDVVYPCKAPAVLRC